MRCGDCRAKWTAGKNDCGNYVPQSVVTALYAAFDSGCSLRRAAARFGISKATVGQYLLLWRSSTQDEVRLMQEYRALETRSEMKLVDLDDLKEIVVEPKRDEDFYPLLLFKGSQSVGRVQALWNFTRAMKAAEAPSVSSFCTFSKNSPDARHLLGLHAAIQHISVRSFLSKLWYSPEVVALDPDMRDYLAFVAGGNPERFFWQFTRVPRFTQWKTNREWRKMPSHLRPARPERTQTPQFWPFVSGAVSQDHDLILQIDGCVPKNLPEQVRQEVCQDLIVSVLSGDVSIDQLLGSVPTHIGNVFKMHPTKYGPLSLDVPAPWQRNDDRPLSRLLATE